MNNYSTIKSILFLILMITCSQKTIAQNIGDSDLIEEFAHQWLEISLNRDRIITFAPDGTFESRNVYDNFKITGQYWLYEKPENASLAYDELVATDKIEGSIQQENPMKQYMDKGIHPDSKEFHGFVIKEVYSNGVIHWSAGVWKVSNDRISMIGGCSYATAINNYFFKGKKIEDQGF